jgi:hypothetical protein
MMLVVFGMIDGILEQRVIGKMHRQFLHVRKL